MKTPPATPADPEKLKTVAARMTRHLSKFDAATSNCLEEKHELFRAQELVRRAFGRYVSEEIAISLRQTLEALELGGEEREVTILMSDLRGFTALAGRLTPHEVIAFLNRYLESMVEVIGRYQGTLEEIIGDAILVNFGAPMTSSDHAQKPSRADWPCNWR